MSAASILKAIAKLTAKGYPDEVAERIAKGELPMDDASRAERAEAMYMGDTFYRGHGKNYVPRSDKDMFMSDSYDVAQTYADGYGGVVTPLRHNADNLLRVDADGMGYDDIDLEPHMVPDLDFDHWMDLGNDDHGTESIAHAVKGEGFRDGTQFDNMIDDMEYRDESAPSTVQNILGSKPDIKIRHADAAFDPQYNGPNIMGGAAGTAGLAGLLAAGQSEESDASVAGLAARGLRLAKKDYGFDLVDEKRGEEVAGRMDLDPYDDGDPMSVGMVELYDRGDHSGQRRGQGIGSLFYDGVEEVTGGVIEPSRAFTEDGARFWAKRDPYAMQELVEAGLLDNESADNVLSALNRGNADPRLLAGTAAGTAGLLAAGQSEDADASVASLAARGLRLAGNDYDFAGGGTVWNILDEKGTKLGGADMGVMDGGNYSAYEMHLNPEHRGTGLMNEAYDAIEEVSGRKIEPSDTLTEDGLKFWMRRDPQKLRGMADKGLLSPWEGNVLESIFAEALEAKR